MHRLPRTPPSGYVPDLQKSDREFYNVRIVSFLCTFDDPEYLDAAIESFKWLPNKLYIIEGAWQSSLKTGMSERSGADTYNIIDKHVDNKKVFLIHANEAGEKEQRQVGLERAKADGADWCWMLDSDEIYTRSTMMAIRNLLQTANTSSYTFRVRSYNFINSFRRWYDGNYARIYRVKPDAKFVQNNDVGFGDCLRWHTSRELPESLRFYHYNYVKKDPAQFWNKMRYHENEDPSFKQRISHQYGHKGNQYKIPSNIQLFTFTGGHPKIMQTHPNLVNNIYGDTDLRFLKE